MGYSQEYLTKLPTHRIVCLANSYKHDHRCVAGVSLNTKRWVRLVGNTIPGCLTLAEASYEDGSQVAPLDVFEAELAEPSGTKCHPEDVRIGRSPLTRFRTFDNPSDLRFLSTFKAKAGEVLQGSRDRISASWVNRAHVSTSLALVHPDDLWWWIRNDGKRKNRALFRSNRTRFELAVTDPVWLDRLSQLEPGIYPHLSFVSDRQIKTFLTISLSEEFERFHYKLVAGVLCLPAQERAYGKATR